MNKTKREKLANYFKTVKNRLEKKRGTNSFNEEDATTISRLVEAIEALESDEEEHSLQDVRDLVERIFAEAEGDDEAFIEGEEAEAAKNRKVRNSMKRSIRQIVLNASKETKKWIDTPEAVAAFAACLKNSANVGVKFAQEWKGVLTKNGVTGFLFPTVVDEQIQSTWKNKSMLFAEITRVADVSFNIRFTAQDQAALEVRAKGHVKGAVKTDQSVILQNKKVDLSTIYKQIPFHRLDLAQLGDKAGPTINWFVTELGTQLAWEIDRTILLGDGRANNSPDKIREIESIANAAAGNLFSIRKETSAGVPAKLVDIYDLLLTMNIEGNTYIYMSRATFGTYSKYTSVVTGEVKWYSEEEIARMLGITEVRLINMPLVNEAGETVAAIIAQPSGMVRVGGDIFGEQWTSFMTNEEYYRSEVFVGTGIRKPYSQGYIVNKSA